MTIAHVRCSHVSKEARMESIAESLAASWTFLTNHAHVLLCIARDPHIRLRDLAARVGITERAAQRIVSDLVKEGYVIRHRMGRRNHYEVCLTRHLRHPVERHRQVSALLAILDGEETSTTTRAATERQL
jgi:DNA-binding MarR family transcriptional regulator